MNLPGPLGTDGLANRCITALPRLQIPSRVRSERDLNPRYQRGITVFKTAAFDRSAIAPLNCSAILSYLHCECQVLACNILKSPRAATAGHAAVAIAPYCSRCRLPPGLPGMYRAAELQPPSRFPSLPPSCASAIFPSSFHNSIFFIQNV